MARVSTRDDRVEQAAEEVDRATARRSRERSPDAPSASVFGTSSPKTIVNSETTIVTTIRAMAPAVLDVKARSDASRSASGRLEAARRRTPRRRSR